MSFQLLFFKVETLEGKLGVGAKKTHVKVYIRAAWYDARVKPHRRSLVELLLARLMLFDAAIRAT
jgi:hypothetical protein